MKKILIIALLFFLTGCPGGDRINLYPAQWEIRNSELCIFVDKQHLIANENILDLKIWDYARQSFVYEKSYALNPIMLEAGKCIPGVDGFTLIPGKSYSVMIRTPLHAYEARFDKAM